MDFGKSLIFLPANELKTRFLVKRRRIEILAFDPPCEAFEDPSCRAARTRRQHWVKLLDTQIRAAITEPRRNALNSGQRSVGRRRDRLLADKRRQGRHHA